MTRGKVIRVEELPGFVAVEAGEIAGAVLYHIDAGECEIVVLYSLRENQGIGGALIGVVVQAAQARACRRVWLITMNDNTRAIRFYQRLGFSLKAVHIDAFEHTQKIKGMPEGVILGIDDIPIRHEFEFERKLGDQ